MGQSHDEQPAPEKRSPGKEQVGKNPLKLLSHMYHLQLIGGPCNLSSNNSREGKQRTHGYVLEIHNNRIIVYQIDKAAGKGHAPCYLTG